MNLENFSNLKAKLQTSWVDVVFRKADGSDRKMTCTTNFELIPEQFHPKKKDGEEKPVEQKAEVSNLFKVFEKDNGWRSFRYNTLISIDGEEVIHDSN